MEHRIIQHHGSSQEALEVREGNLAWLPSQAKEMLLSSSGSASVPGHAGVSTRNNAPSAEGH